ncbi:MAG: hypothetical protein JWM20_356 [Patescibacteria group bacterium]|nr:hypothetical protein [Patescibacteria group bacterium]
MRKIMKSLAAVVMIALVFTTSSCSKTKTDAPPAVQLSQQTNYKMGTVTYNDVPITNLAMALNIDNTAEMTAYIELHLNALEATAATLSSSKITLTAETNPQRTFQASKLSGSTVELTFVNENNGQGTFVASSDETIPQGLFTQNLLTYHQNNNGGPTNGNPAPPSGYYTFAASCLSGNYKVETSTDGFRLISTAPGKTVVINLISTL